MYPTMSPPRTLRLPTVVAALRSASRRALSMLRLWHRRARTRRQLAGLPPERLRDAGVTRGQAAHEAAKPFWRG